MSTNTALDDIKARVEGHMEGPWVVDGFADGDHVRLAAFAGMNQGAVIAADIHNSGNAELIAAAPKLLAALEAVEALHYAREDTEDLFSADCGEGLCSHAGRDDECPTVTIAPCVECSIPGVYYIAYPCPTLTAITDALA